MKRLKLLIEVDYDDQVMHSGTEDAEAYAWFHKWVLGGPMQLVSHEIGDVVGEVVSCEEVP